MVIIMIMVLIIIVKLFSNNIIQLQSLYYNEQYVF